MLFVFIEIYRIMKPVNTLPSMLHRAKKITSKITISSHITPFITQHLQFITLQTLQKLHNFDKCEVSDFKLEHKELQNK